MKHIDNLNSIEGVEGGSFDNLPAGGYVCKIVSGEDIPEKEYLRLEYDIAEGEYAGWWQKTFDNAAFWGGKLFRSYKESALKFFKGFITAVEQSNGGYHWNDDEKTLIGKHVGLVLGEEEYTKNDGTIGTRLYVARNTSIDKIRSGEFDVPELKRLSKSKSGSSFREMSESKLEDGDLPF